MVKITEHDVEQAAISSRLELTEAEKTAYTESINNILEFLDKLEQLDTSNVELVERVLPLKNVFREDKLQSSLTKEQVLANAPEVEAGCFKVPRIV